MTIINKKSNPVPFSGNRHYRATDKISFKVGNRSGEVTRSGSAYLLRLKENPHNAEWVIFSKGGSNDNS